MKFEQLLKQYKVILEQDLPKDATQPPVDAPTVPDADQMAQGSNPEPDSQLEPNEQVLLDILTKVGEVLKSYMDLVRQKGVETSDEEYNQLSQLLSDTAKNKLDADNVGTVLKHFVDKFGSIFESHIKKIQS